MEKKVQLSSGATEFKIRGCDQNGLLLVTGLSTAWVIVFKNGQSCLHMVAAPRETQGGHRDHGDQKQTAVHLHQSLKECTSGRTGR